MKQSVDIPIRIRLTIENPMIAPPLKAKTRDFPAEVRAVFATLTFALTVPLMPTKIASMEKRTPITNPNAICQPKRKYKRMARGIIA